jgi:hypothetical protein
MPVLPAAASTRILGLLIATIGANGEPQSSPMWFLWDGEYLKFTHTTTRKKYQNIKRDPRVILSVKIHHVVGENLARYTQVLITKPDINLGVMPITKSRKTALPGPMAWVQRSQISLMARTSRFFRVVRLWLLRLVPTRSR